MTTTQTSTVIHHLCRTALLRDGADLTDGQLLERFIDRRDELAFAALVHRHGPLVWGVCRRLLGHHDAEDAFQATFLVLFRKAGTIVPRERVASWLYGVAQQTALHCRRTAARRISRERQVAEMPEPQASPRDPWADLQPLLDQELSRLPDRFRVVLILCDLEGQTRKEAAQQLGVPEGTVAGWLARARELLARRLSKHGFAVSAAVLATLLAQNASAAVPASVLAATIDTASLLAAGPAAAGLIPVTVAALTEGVLKTMLLAKLKNLTVAVLLTVLACSGFGLLALTVTAGPPSRNEASADATGEAPRPRAAAPEREMADANPVFTLYQDPRAQRGPTPPEVRAVVKSVDVAASTITVQVAGDRQAGPMEKTFTLVKDVEVAVGASGLGRGAVLKPAKLTDLAAGTTVSLALSADQKTVTSILAEGPVVRAQLKTVDVAKGTITVNTTAGRGRGEEPAVDEKTYAVSKEAEIALDDGRGRRFSIKEGKLADLAGGALVTVWLSVDQKEAVGILAEGPSFGGTIKAIDKKTITLVAGAGRGQAGDERTFEVGTGATILIDDGKGRRLSLKTGTPADLTLGAVALVKLTVDSGSIATIRVEGPVIGGMIKSVDATKGTITFALPAGRGENPEEKTLPVAPDARIVIENAETKLADIKIPENGLHAMIRLTLDQKSIQAVTSISGDRGGR
jgi:RNA polymerase sigma factor (sigma-70 family)